MYTLNPKKAAFYRGYGRKDANLLAVAIQRGVNLHALAC